MLNVKSTCLRIGPSGKEKSFFFVFLSSSRLSFGSGKHAKEITLPHHVCVFVLMKTCYISIFVTLTHSLIDDVFLF